MRSSRMLIAALVLSLAAGCGGKLLKTRGRVVKSGQPFLPGQGEFVRVTFVPVIEGGKPAHDFFVAEYNSTDGTFQVAGKNGKGMPPGRYRVAVELDRKRRDLLKGQFDAERSPFLFDVDANTDAIVIDLDSPPKS